MREEHHTNLPDEIGGGEYENKVSWWEIAFYALVLAYFGGHFVLYLLGIKL